jgi:hypothetical protein
MSSRNYQGIVQTLNVQPRIIAGSFAPNGSSAISAASNLGLGWSVAYVSTGLYRVTLTDSFPYLLSVVASLQVATADDKFAANVAYTASTKVLDIRVYDLSTGALADVAADAGNRINFMCLFQDSSVTPVYGA